MKKIFIYIILLILISASTATAGSIFASKGLGIPAAYPNARALGMGGVLTSTYNSRNISTVNPASMSAIELTSLSIQYIHEVIGSDDGINQVTSDYGNLHGFDFIIPLGKGFGFGAGLHPATHADYYLDFEVEGGLAPYRKTVKSTGGLNTSSMSASWAVHDKVKLGLTGQYYFGKYTERWTINYDHSGFTSTKDEYTTRSSGIGYTLGMIVIPIKNVFIGTTLSPESKINSKTDLKSTFEDSLKMTEGDFTYPASWGIGISYQIPNIGMVGFDMKYQAWDNLKINNNKNMDVKSTLAYGMGVEFQRSDNPYASYMRRTAYRLGLFYTPLPMLDIHNESIVETGFSVGLGLPLMMNKAYIDFAFMMSKRGSIDKNDLEENIYRFSVNISGTEKWFQRRY